MSEQGIDVVELLIRQVIDLVQTTADVINNSPKNRHVNIKPFVTEQLLYRNLEVNCRDKAKLYARFAKMKARPTKGSKK